MRRILLAVLLLVLAAVEVRAQADGAAACAAPSAVADGWTTAAPDTVGLDGSRLCDLEGFLKAWPMANIHAVVVARRGKLVLEHYRAGKDLHFGKEMPAQMVSFGPAVKHDLRSISKSVTSLLVGIALAEGRFPALDSPVIDGLPDYAALRTPDNARITFRHLLTMTHGQKWDENARWNSPDNTERPMYEATDPYRYILGQPVVVAPGTVFNYSGGATSLLAYVLARSTGQRIDAYAREKLFAPLSIVDFDWETFPNSPEIAAFGGLRLRPRDLAKLGQLLVANGSWNGRQVVPADWIAESIKPRVNTEGLFFYGYQWWLGRSLWRGREIHWVAGVGLGGQRLFAVPELDLVVAVNSAHYDGPLQANIPLAILNRFVLPAIRD